MEVTNSDWKHIVVADGLLMCMEVAYGAKRCVGVTDAL